MTAVRYYSRSGNTKLIAEAIAKAAGTQAVSVDAPQAPIQQPVDILFIGGALYAYGLDQHLRDYLATLDASKVKKAVLFSSSWISKHALDLMRNALTEKGIPVEQETFYVRNRPSEARLAEAAAFAKKFLA